MSQFEVEIKSLLGEKAHADALKEKLQHTETDFIFVTKNKQLNHYFTGGDIEALYSGVAHFFTQSQQEQLRYVIEHGEGFSVRTRQKDTDILLVVKASLDGGTSENTVTRIEFEEAIAITLDELDALVQAAGFHYQAKWSREREEYHYGDISICFDKNAGYGYLVEFEKIVTTEADLPAAKQVIVDLMESVGVEELSQERLARMFDFYNQNWADYYGTDKTFIIE